ncbi:unnamed protein product [Sphenostylis stenocarpa]|uniref:TIR domain-containing protein n=1 Tax=Sphenostylis stenocarpa TaxID=92480 RepID=A0AA86TFP6_9FABA|nr:unnamed protein product [Sphenostylis stenocarpa]
MSKKKVGERKYDVFVSFHGADIRRVFLCHLVEGFKSKTVKVFVDDEIERGEEIWPSLVEAIEGSSISLIIFSQGYASSHWCLDEVVKIIECREKDGQIVIPVFYCIEPKDVRDQLGSYKNAFDEHEIKYERKVPIWRHALNKSTLLAGIQSSKFRDDADLLKNIVDVVSTRLDKTLIEGKVGNDKKIEKMESVIHKESIWSCPIQKIFSKLCGNRECWDMGGKIERKARWTHLTKRICKGFQPLETSNFIYETSFRELSSELAEAARRKAEFARLRELRTLKGHVESVVKLKEGLTCITGMKLEKKENYLASLHMLCSLSNHITEATKCGVVVLSFSSLLFHPEKRAVSVQTHTFLCDPEMDAVESSVAME